MAPHTPADKKQTHLSPDDQVLRNKCFTARGRPAEIVAQLAQLEGFKERCEEQANRWQWPLSLLFLAVAGTSIVSLWFCLLIPVPLILFGLLLYLTSHYTLLKNATLDRHRCAIAQHWMRHLACDLPRRRAVSITVDFRSGLLGDALPSKRDSKAQRQSGTSRSQYGLKWFEFRGTLLDGSKLQLAVTLRTSRKTKTKRRYLRIREQLQQFVTLRVEPARIRAADLNAVPDYLAERIPKPIRWRSGTIRNNAISLSVFSPRQERLYTRYNTTNSNAEEQLIDPHFLLKLIIATYSAMADCRAGKRPLSKKKKK